MTTKKEIISFIFDFEEISESKMKLAMKKDKSYLIKLANQYENDKENKKFYRALCIG